ncbi:MAG TPA: hypothetical protein VIT91_16915 [Chthoniobacterales bacterium]
MKSTSVCLIATLLASSVPLPAQVQPPPATTTATVSATAVPEVPFEPLPTLNAGTILQPQYLSGANFTVRNAVPTYSGSNQYTIDSDFGVFTASGNQMLLRRVAEINGIAKLQALSQTDEFAQAAAQAVATPLNVAQDLVTDPVDTISSVPRGIWGFLNRAGDAVKQATEGQGGGLGSGNAVANMSGFSKTKRDLALKLGVDPYCNNEAFQRELNKVAWPAFLGKFTVDLGMAAVTGGAGTALSVANWTATLQDSLRDKSPTDLRQMNFNLLTNNMGAAGADADAFLNNGAISPTTQTLIVAALAQLGNIPGQAAFIRQAAGSQNEHDALAFQQSAQIIANLNNTAPVARITHFEGLTVCQTNDGTVVVPIQWDYVAWTPGVAKFVTALKARKFSTPPTAYTLMINGVASPAATQALGGLGVNLVTKALPGPLQ